MDGKKLFNKVLLKKKKKYLCNILKKYIVHQNNGIIFMQLWVLYLIFKII